MLSFLLKKGYELFHEDLDISLFLLEIVSECDCFLLPILLDLGGFYFWFA